MQDNPSDTTPENTSVAMPYAPSFLDRFMRFVQHLPIPYWLTYSLLFLVQSVINHSLAWLDGWLPAFSFNSILLLFPAWQWGTLAIITFLNKTSETAISSFHPLLNVNDVMLEKLKYEFTNMPTRGVIVSGVMWTIVYLFLTYLTYEAFYVQYGLGKYFQVFTFLEGLICYFTGSVIYYHSLRQLWLVNRTVKMVMRFNLFRLEPVYAFSHLTARAGISWMFMLGLTLLTFPLDLAQGLVLAILILQVILALAAFVLPLRFVNYHLVAEKRRLIAKLNQRVEATLEQVHHSIDENKPGEVEHLNSALTGLNTEREILTNIPTWPWRAGTLSGFLSAIALPIILLLAQIAIERFLAR
jgi:hypothetical protein